VDFVIRQSGNHPENNLAKFGYILDMNAGQKPKSFYILGYLLELVIKIWRIWAISFHENSFALDKIIFFKSKIEANSPVKERVSLSEFYMCYLTL
jgi:hypothetical protein